MKPIALRFLDMSLIDGKKTAAKKAAEFVEDQMIIGLGTGSTAAFFIEALVEKLQKGLKIQAVASSRRSADLARKGGIEVIDINAAPRVHLTVDGADEVDPKKRMIKGAGGAHVREKILAAASDEMIVIVDESKLVPSLGKAKLPVEILFYGSPATRTKLEELGLQSAWRMNEDGTLFITENGNLLLDIHCNALLEFPEQTEAMISAIPGVVDTGFFFNLATQVIVGYSDGHSNTF